MIHSCRENIVAFEHPFTNNVDGDDGAKERPMVAKTLRCLSRILAEAKSGSRSLCQGFMGSPICRYGIWKACTIVNYVRESQEQTKTRRLTMYRFRIWARSPSVSSTNSLAIGPFWKCQVRQSYPSVNARRWLRHNHCTQ